MRTHRGAARLASVVTLAVGFALGVLGVLGVVAMANANAGAAAARPPRRPA